jgi:putative proteasome-type protease
VISYPDRYTPAEGEAVTYCLGIMTQHGLVMASDSRTNAGMDQVNTCRKMHLFVREGDRVFTILCSGGLSVSQSVVTLLRRDFDEGLGLAKAATFYDAARVVGEQVRRVAAMDREALERDDFRFNIHLLLGGQIGREPPNLYMIYPQGNPIMATEDSPYLQIGESKYGRPILDRGVKFRQTTLQEAAKFALISLDSTMRSNVTVGPPIDLMVYRNNDLRVTHYRRFTQKDPDLQRIQYQWEHALRKAALELPDVSFDEGTDQVI